MGHLLRGPAGGPPVTQDFASADEALWCRLTKPVPAGGLLGVLLSAAEPRGTPSHPVKKEPAEPECLAPCHSDIQLLPQQAGMASILATAVINSEYATGPPQLRGSAGTPPRTSRPTKIGYRCDLSRGCAVMDKCRRA